MLEVQLDARVDDGEDRSFVDTHLEVALPRPNKNCQMKLSVADVGRQSLTTREMD